MPEPPGLLPPPWVDSCVHTALLASGQAAAGGGRQGSPGLSCVSDHRGMRPILFTLPRVSRAQSQKLGARTQAFGSRLASPRPRDNAAPPCRSHMCFPHVHTGQLSPQVLRHSHFSGRLCQPCSCGHRADGRRVHAWPRPRTKGPACAPPKLLCSSPGKRIVNTGCPTPPSPESGKLPQVRSPWPGVRIRQLTTCGQKRGR